MDKETLKSRVQKTMPKSSAISAVSPTTALVPAMKLRDDLKTEIATIQIANLIVRDDDTYREADAVLFQIGQALEKIESRFNPIISPIRKGLDEIYKLKRELVTPLEDAVKVIKGKMKVFKIDEDRRIQAQKDAQEAEQQRLEREAADKQRKAEAAVTPQMRGKLESQASRAVEAAIAVAAQPISAPVRVAGSSDRKIPSWKVTDMAAVIAGVAECNIPEDVLVLDTAKVREYFKANPKQVGKWPGFELFNDVQIVRG